MTIPDKSSGSTLPRVFPLERVVDSTHVADPAAAVADQFKSLYPKGNELEGMRIGLTAVSRQIANYLVLFRAVIRELRARGAEVYIVPAIGSHGGGTEIGNLRTLGLFGVREGKAVEHAEIIARSDTSHVDTVDGVEVHCLNSVLEDLDGVFLFGRVRRHWDIRWPKGRAEELGCRPLESGLSKLFLGMAMLEAKKLHDHHDDLGWAVQIAAKRLLEEPRVNVVGGLAVVDNEEEQTALVQGVPYFFSNGAASSEDFFRRELAVLEYSRRFLPYLPFADEPCHLLYLHYFGKPYAGQGADSKIIGRNGGIRNWCEGTPRFDYVCASRLIGSRDNKDLAGPFNAMGIGNLDVITRRFYDAVDRELTRKNAITAARPHGAAEPRVAANDLAMIHSVLGDRSSDSASLRMMFAVSTVWMRLIYLSEEYFDRARGLDGFIVRGNPRPIPFDAQGFVDFPAFENI